MILNKKMTDKKAPTGSKNGITITVGQENAHIVGNDHLALQAAVDYVANHGGGTVHIGPGEYAMFDSLHLRRRYDISTSLGPYWEDASGYGRESGTYLFD